MNNLSNADLTAILAAADAVISAMAGENDDVHPDNASKMIALWDDLNDRQASPAVVKAMARELLAYREAAKNPVVIVEESDYLTAAQMTGKEPRRKAVRELYEGALIVGNKLYTAPQLPAVPDDLLHMAASAIEDLLDHTDPNTSYYAGVWADEPGKLRAATQQTANSPVIPDGWISVVERLPEKDGNYWGWWSDSKRQGPVWFIKSDLQSQFQSSEITHWMPLPAAPKPEGE